MDLRPTRLPLMATLILALSLAACAKKQEEAAMPAIPPTELAAIDTPPPAYPAEAECDGEGGTTVLRVTIDKDGVPAQVAQALVLMLCHLAHGGQDAGVAEVGAQQGVGRHVVHRQALHAHVVGLQAGVGGIEQGGRARGLAGAACNQQDRHGVLSGRVCCGNVHDLTGPCTCKWNEW